ncbi:MAG: FAD-dependent oxidoreductase [Firmicutes bacterium]|nr:FAD-dependent oxidoreductase [Bacillota bacterium]
MYDLVIVGTGPAGMTAAVYAARKKLRTLLVGREYGGQATRSLAIENYMGYQYITGPELMRKFEEQVQQYPVEMRRAEVTRIVRRDRGFETQTAEGDSFLSRAVIVATGKRPRRLNVPGERELLGRGVTYCAVCDAPLFAGMPVAVVGGGNAAVEAAWDLTKHASRVFVVSLAEWRADPVLAERALKAPNLERRVGYETVRIEGDGTVTGLVIRRLAEPREEERLDVRGVFVEIGSTPNSHIVAELAELNAVGEILVDCDGRTQVPGLFAAGDVTSVPDKQVIVAAGEGAKAALSAYRYLAGSPD